MTDHPSSRNRRRVVRNTKAAKPPEGMVWDKHALQFVEIGKENKEPNTVIPKGIPDFLY